MQRLQVPRRMRLHICNAAAPQPLLRRAAAAGARGGRWLCWLMRSGKHQEQEDGTALVWRRSAQRAGETHLPAHPAGKPAQR